MDRLCLIRFERHTHCGDGPAARAVVADADRTSSRAANALRPPTYFSPASAGYTCDRDAASAVVINEQGPESFSPQTYHGLQRRCAKVLAPPSSQKTPSCASRPHPCYAARGPDVDGCQGLSYAGTRPSCGGRASEPVPHHKGFDEGVPRQSSHLHDLEGRLDRTSSAVSSITA